MKKQSIIKKGSIIRISKNSLGNGKLYLTKDGFFKIRKPGLTAERVKTDPAFHRTRLHAQEFGCAAQTGKLIRRGFRKALVRFDKSNISGRLTREVLKAIRADTVNETGYRNLLQGSPDLLEGFAFNDKLPLHSLLKAPYRVKEYTGKQYITVHIPSFENGFSQLVPCQVSHVKFMLLCARLDMDKMTVAASEHFTKPLSLKSVKDTRLTVRIRTGKQYINLLALGVEFCYEVKSRFYLAAGIRALDIIKVLPGTGSRKSDA